MILYCLAAVANDSADTSGVVARLVHAVQPWRDTYSNSTVVSTGVLFLHLSALLVAGGLAITADRTTLRISVSDSRERARHLNDLASTHRTVVRALALACVTGLLLLTADLESFLGMRAFWIKMSLVILLLLNGALMLGREHTLRNVDTSVDVATDPKLRRVWSWLRFHAVTSLTLWFATLLAGTALTAG